MWRQTHLAPERKRPAPVPMLQNVGTWNVFFRGVFVCAVQRMDHSQARAWGERNLEAHHSEITVARVY